VTQPGDMTPAEAQVLREIAEHERYESQAGGRLSDDDGDLEAEAGGT
jgi:hypothetical protein